MSRSPAAVLLDMNGTFMFGHDRFGPGEDFHATYRRLGGHALGARDVDGAVRRCLVAFEADYGNPQCFERFPTLSQHVRRHARVPAAQCALIERVIAWHERGAVPRWAADAIRRLARRWPLAIVSNVWASPENWHEPLVQAGVADSFAVQVFSSALGAVKPSHLPFLRACEALGLRPDEALMVGDSVSRDIVPARELGMQTCRVGPGHRAPEPDFALARLDLLPLALEGAGWRTAG